MINAFETEIISNVLKGDHKILSAVGKQLTDLSVVRREIEGNSYFVEFGYVGLDDELEEISDCNIEIIDTRFLEEETNQINYVKLTILKGHVRFLHVSNSSGFGQRAPAIRRFFWCSSFKKQYSDEEMVGDPRKRDFKKAIGYIPSYK